MDRYKTQEQVEFADLFAKLDAKKIRAKEVARVLRVTPQAVSMYLKGVRNPRPLTLAALRDYVRKLCGASAAPAENDADQWRTRALLAERELEKIHRALGIKASSGKERGTPRKHPFVEILEKHRADRPK